jgi:hypothetical protein
MMERWDVDVEKVKSDIKTDIDALQKMLNDTIEQYGNGEEDETQGQEVTRSDEVNG